ncbi:MAG: heparinase II/III family protein [Alphaproteobacteria bacterium]|nr:heparinase II/III family protein [Alphaproteobacteria bacterium]
MSAADRFVTAAYLKSPLYRLALRGKTPTALRSAPSDAWPGSADRGREIVAGRFEFFGKALEAGLPPWQFAEEHAPGDPWRDELHAFNWLRDLATLGGDASRKTARHLVSSWLDRYSHYDAVAWRPATTARRVANWITLFDFVCGAADEALGQRVLAHLALQTRHVMARLADLENWPDRMQAARGLCAAAAAFGDELTDAADWLDEAVAIIDEAAQRLVGEDGGHVSRSPSAQIRFLRDLIDARAGLTACGAALPESARAAMTPLAGMVRFLRHGDGHLTLFQDSNLEEAALIEAVLAQTDRRAKAPAVAPEMAYERLQAGRSTVIFDVGPPRPGGHAHASALAFEFSVGRERLVVNCGAASGLADWNAALRRTPAHSALCVDGRDTSEIDADGALGTRLASVEWTRTEAEGSSLVEARHDGYVDLLGLSHSRSLYLGADGDDLRGEDRLVGAGGYPFEIRFHLHPRVVAQPTQGGAVLLRLPGGGGWRFETKGAPPEIAESVYFGDRGHMQKTRQIVLSRSHEGGETIVNWAFRRGAR